MSPLRACLSSVKPQLKITLQSADRSLERVMIAHARIIRQSIDAFPEGIAIDSVNFLPEGGAGG